MYKEVEYGVSEDYISAAPPPPAPLQPIKAQHSGVKAITKPTRPLIFKLDIHMSKEEVGWLSEALQRCRIGKLEAQVSFDLVGRRKVNLLEDLRRDGDTASGLNATKRIFSGFSMGIADTSIFREILLQRASIGGDICTRHVVVIIGFYNCPAGSEEEQITIESRELINRKGENLLALV